MNRVGLLVLVFCPTIVLIYKTAAYQVIARLNDSFFPMKNFEFGFAKAVLFQLFPAFSFLHAFQILEARILKFEGKTQTFNGSISFSMLLASKLVPPLNFWE